MAPRAGYRDEAFDTNDSFIAVGANWLTGEPAALAAAGGCLLSWA